MEQLVLRFWNEDLKIAVGDWRTVFYINVVPLQLIPEMYKGNLVYRIPGSFKRFSYAAIKKNLVYKKITIAIEPFPF